MHTTLLQFASVFFPVNFYIQYRSSTAMAMAVARDVSSYRLLLRRKNGSPNVYLSHRGINFVSMSLASCTSSTRCSDDRSRELLAIYMPFKLNGKIFTLVNGEPSSYLKMSLHSGCTYAASFSVCMWTTLMSLNCAALPTSVMALRRGTGVAAAPWANTVWPGIGNVIINITIVVNHPSLRINDSRSWPL